MGDLIKSLASDDEAERLAQLLAHAGDARNQRRTALFVDQVDETVAQFDRHQRAAFQIVANLYVHKCLRRRLGRTE